MENEQKFRETRLKTEDCIGNRKYKYEPESCSLCFSNNKDRIKYSIISNNTQNKE